MPPKSFTTRSSTITHPPLQLISDYVLFIKTLNPSTIKAFSLVCPLPRLFDVNARITKLENSLDPKITLKEHPSQYENIKAVINLYKIEIRKDNKEKIYLIGGRVVSKSEAMKSP